MRQPILLSVLVIGSVLHACGSGTDFPQGAEKGRCYPNQTCNAGLVCLSDTCVNPSPTPTGGTDGAVPVEAAPRDGDGVADVPIVFDVASGADSASNDSTINSSGGAIGTGGSMGLGGMSGLDAGRGSGGSAGTGGGGDDIVTFSSGKAQGVMTGKGWIDLGAAAIATSPVCNNAANGGGTSEPITEAGPCPEAGGKTVWSTSDALCISGSIPAVTGGDYLGNWGIQINANVSDTPGLTLGKSYSKITFATRGSISPTNTAIRAIVHRKGDVVDAAYCATIQSGLSVTLTAFNTKCWDGSGTSLTAADIPDIDRIGIQISSDDKNAYAITDYCLTGISFDSPPPGTGGAGGAGGAPSAGGNVGTGGTSNTGGSQPPAAVDCPDTSTFSALVTGQYGGNQIPVDGNANKSYFMHANWWGTPYKNQSENIEGIGFTMKNPDNASSSNSTPIGYPSIFIGSYQSKSSKGSNLPKQLSSLSSVPTIFSTNSQSIGWSNYNAAYDVWLTSGSSPLGGSAVDPGTGGAFLMVWLFKPTDRMPRGTIFANGLEVPGVPGSWTVWIDNTNPSCVSYVSDTKLSSLEFDLNLFLQDSVKKKYGNITASQYLSVVFAGFEVWGGGDGLQLKKFCANVK
jgi:hypothetical protein